MTRSGLPLDDLDPAVRPQDDLDAHVNGRWAASYVIPPDRAMDGPFRALYDEAERQVLDIITDAAKDAGAHDAGSVEAKIGALYASFMDTDAVAAAGVEPLREDLALVDGATTVAELTTALGALQRTGAVSGVDLYVDNDAKDPDTYVVHLVQGGLGLPDEAYYREEQHAEVREKYLPHVARMLRLAAPVSGVVAAGDPDELAARVVALETRLASHHWDVVKDRDAELTYNALTLAELAEQAPGFDWYAWAEALGAPAGALDRLVVREPSFAEGFATLWGEVPLADWQAWATYHVVSSRAPYLTDELVEANFAFSYRVSWPGMAAALVPGRRE